MNAGDYGDDEEDGEYDENNGDDSDDGNGGDDEGELDDTEPSIAA